jgi:4-hydroxybenzoate polyprenyltransferase
MKSHAAAQTDTRANEAADARKAGRLSTALRALRVHQWIKNLLVFVPVLMAHRIMDAAALRSAAFAFFAWSLCASSVYLVNDLLDLEADRLHPQKRHRPLASGSLDRSSAALLVPALLVPGLGLAFWLLPPLFGMALLLYLALSTAYSLFLKRLVVLDVMVLAGLYTLRVLSGGIATNVSVSPWLLAFSMFLFLSLAFVKRYTELRAATLGDARGEGSRRGYTREDMELLKSFGTSSGYLSVLVLALYINQSREVTVLYRSPAALWLIGPCLLYWITRVWLLASRGRMHDDPVVFTVKDPVSYALGLIIAALIVAASL